MTIFVTDYKNAASVSSKASEWDVVYGETVEDIGDLIRTLRVRYPKSRIEIFPFSEDYDESTS